MARDQLVLKAFLEIAHRLFAAPDANDLTYASARESSAQQGFRGGNALVLGFRRIRRGGASTTAPTNCSTKENGSQVKQKAFHGRETLARMLIMFMNGLLNLAKSRHLRFAAGSNGHQDRTRNWVGPVLAGHPRD